MDEMRPEALVLRDKDGNYYVIGLETLERARVPEAEKAAFEQTIAGGDVIGFGAGVPSAIGGDVVPVPGSFLVEEYVEPWPAMHGSNEGGLRSAIRTAAAWRF